MNKLFLVIIVVVLAVSGIWALKSIAKAIRDVNEPDIASVSPVSVKRYLAVHGISTEPNRLLYVNRDLTTYIFVADQVTLGINWQVTDYGWKNGRETLAHKGNMFGYTNTSLDSSNSNILRRKWKDVTGGQLP